MEHNRNLKRFEAKIEKVDSGCWLWKAGLKGGGYGVFWLNGALRGAHRASLYLYKQESLETSLHAMHSCDNPSCVNPDHLSYGTASQNMADASAKGRIALTGDWTGTRNPKAKLSESQRMSLDARLANGERNRTLANEFGISIVRVQQIARQMKAIQTA